ncbi:MAG: acyl-ACP--UDP-N-acetylglucosamine O-acyltransferase [Caulobacterales bacterium]
MHRIHPTAVVDGAAVLGDGVEIGPYCLIGPHVRLGDHVRLHSHVVVDGHTEVGDACEVFPFAFLGGPPQHTAYKGEPTRLVIGPRNEIREHVTMHRGTPGGRGVTTVGADGLYYVGAHVAHDCIVGDQVIMTNSATLGGHVLIQDFAILGGLCAVHQFARVGRYAFVGGLAAVTFDVIPYGSVFGNHACLEGLNLRGLKRRGFSREQINTLRAAYRMLFADTGVFQDRLAQTAAAFAHSPEVTEVVDFIRADANRPLTMPVRER